MPTRATVTAVLALLLPLVATGCNLGHSSASTTVPTTVGTTTTSEPASPTPTSAAAPTTTVYKPVNVQTSPDDAAARLIATWADGDRHGAGEIATPSAVSTLFAVPYPNGGVEARGCTDSSVDPGTCTYADLATGSLYEVGVVQSGTDWYVSTVTVEN